MDNSLKNQVYDYIVDKIHTGALIPDNKITELGIAKEMGISRTPVREALIQMVSDDLLVKVERGFSVKPYNIKKKEEVFQIIGVLDALAGSLAAEHLTEEDFLKMEELTEKMDIAIKYKNYLDYCDCKKEFHNTYIDKCHNQSLIELLKSMIYTTMPKTYWNKDMGVAFHLLSEYSNKEHKMLVEAFKKRDSGEVESILKTHWVIVDEESV